MHPLAWSICIIEAQEGRASGTSVSLVLAPSTPQGTTCPIFCQEVDIHNDHSMCFRSCWWQYEWYECLGSIERAPLRGGNAQEPINEHSHAFTVGRSRLDVFSDLDGKRDCSRTFSCSCRVLANAVTKLDIELLTNRGILYLSSLTFNRENGPSTW